MRRKRRKEFQKPSNIREEIWNLPNTLTLARIIVIPLVVYLMLVRSREAAFFAALLFSAAAATDFFDGYIARKRGLVSLWGQFLDPVADKLIVMATTITAVYLKQLPVWLVVLILAREISITSLRGFAAKEGLTIHVLQTGKWKTAFQLIGLIAVLIGYPYEMNYLIWEGRVDFVLMGAWLLVASMILSAASAIQYFGSFLSAISEKENYTAPPRKKRRRRNRAKRRRLFKRPGRGQKAGPTDEEQSP